MGVVVCVLTEQQKRFADAYIKEPNATQAAIKAGYSKNGANSKGAQLLANISIREYIDKRLKKHESKTVADQAEVLETLTAIMRQQKYDSFIVKLAGGHETVRVPNKVSDAFKAADALAKTYGLYERENKPGGEENTGVIELPNVSKPEEPPNE